MGTVPLLTPPKTLNLGQILKLIGLSDMRKIKQNNGKIVKFYGPRNFFFKKGLFGKKFLNITGQGVEEYPEQCIIFQQNCP